MQHIGSYLKDPLWEQQKRHVSGDLTGRGTESWRRPFSSHACQFVGKRRPFPEATPSLEDAGRGGAEWLKSAARITPRWSRSEGRLCLFMFVSAVTRAPSVLVLSQDLADDLSSELSGNFRSVVLGLLMLPPVYDAHELKNAMKVLLNSSHKISSFFLCHFPNLRLHNSTSETHFSSPAHVTSEFVWRAFGLTWTVLTQLSLSQGAGTEEACLIDILASRTNGEIKAINAFYKKREWSPATGRIPDRGL